jgi:hypothetical protein
LWNVGGRVLLAFEAKSDEGAESDQRVPLRNVREAAGHLNWAKGRGMECHADAAIVLLSHRTVIPDDVRPHGKRVFLVDIPSFRKFADEAVSYVRKLRALTAVGNRDLLLEQFTANLRESTFTAPRIKARLTTTPVGPLGQQAL